jgi:hypothetical protein
MEPEMKTNWCCLTKTWRQVASAAGQRPWPVSLGLVMAIARSQCCDRPTPSDKWIAACEFHPG